MSLLAAVAFFAPGLLLFRSLWRTSVRETFVLSFAVGSFALITLVTWYSIWNLPIRMSFLLPGFAALSFAAFLTARSLSLPAPKRHTNADKAGIDRLAIGIILASSSILLLRSLATPLTGFDTSFRWHHLAMRMVETQSLSFYPPRSATDFSLYFYADGIPPLISSLYFWIHEATGKVSIRLTALSVILQWSAALFLLFDLARMGKGNRRSGLFAVLLALSSVLFFHSFYIGQEAGFLTLGILGTLWSIERFHRWENRSEGTHSTWIAPFLAALFSSLAALSREYGLLSFILGIYAFCLASPKWKRPLVLYLGFGVLFSAPWYLRNAVLTGNPFFDNPVVGLFPSNPVHSQYLEEINRVSGFPSYNISKVSRLLRDLLLFAGVPLLVGTIASTGSKRARMLYIPGTVLFLILTFFTFGYSAGTSLFAFRMALPAVALASLAGGEWLRQQKGKKAERYFKLSCLASGLALFVQLFTPQNPLSIPAVHWLDAMVDQPYFYNRPYRGARPLLDHTQPGDRILSNSVYAYASTLDAERDIVPLWSPEVAFLFTHPDEPQETNHWTKAQIERLRDLRIRYFYLAVDPLQIYLENFPFFQTLDTFASPIWQSGNLSLWRFSSEKDSSVAR